MSRKNKECLVFVTDVGASSLPTAKHTMERLITRKIFLGPRDEIGIVLMGTDDKNNSLDLENIVEMNPLRVPDWETVKMVRNLERTERTSNWVDALNVALSYIDNECVEPKTKRILILMTDFTDNVDRFNVDEIARNIKDRRVLLLSIGNDLDEKNTSMKKFKDVCDKVEGQMMTFDSTLASLQFYKKPDVRVIPWRCDLDLAEIKIPIAAYIKITGAFKVPSWDRIERTENPECEPSTVERNRLLLNNENIPCGSMDAIDGYMFGRKFIPFSDEDIESMSYKSGPKCLSIICFTDRKYVKCEYLTGDSTYVIVPTEESATSPFYSLVKAMDESNTVAIVRRVYNNNNAPKIGALFPHIDVPGDPWCLLFIELLFAEDRRVPPPDCMKETLSQQQEDAVDDLIDSMMLTKVHIDDTEEVGEAFVVGTVHDPSIQHFWDQLAHRALFPDKPLPPMKEFLRKILEVPASVAKEREHHLRIIEQLFKVIPDEMNEPSKGGLDDPDEPDDQSKREVWNTLDALPQDKSCKEPKRIDVDLDDWSDN